MKTKKRVPNEDRRDPYDFYDFGPGQPANKAYLDTVMPDHLKKLIAERKKQQAKSEIEPRQLKAKRKRPHKIASD